MNTEDLKAPLRSSSATIITRDSADPQSPRLITDDASILCVRAFALSQVGSVAATGVLNAAGAYALTGRKSGENGVYVGESGSLARRLQEHAIDPAKAWVNHAFVLYGLDRRLDKAAAVHLQKRLSDKIQQANSARLIQGVGPCSADLPAWRIASLDRMFEAALPLLFDAGCAAIVPAPLATAGLSAEETGREIEPLPVLVESDIAADDDGDEGPEEAPMRIGVTTTPVGVQEQALSFGNLWARGYKNGERRFIVAAGSELRRDTNPSATEHTRKRRTELIAKGAVRRIDGVDDRLRLELAVDFPSMAIAAAALCGAHVASDKWRPLLAEQPCVVTR